MKPLKYRVWDKVNKEWAKDFTLSQDGELLCNNGSTLFFRNDFEVGFSSDCKDKNGKEIYCGDICLIKIYIGINYMISNICILYKDGIFGYEIYTGFGNCEMIELDGSEEIIGNIYENPELLEAKNEK